MSAHRAIRPTIRSARIAGIGGVLLALVTASGLVWQASYSSFSAVTTNPGNTWSVGSVTLTNESPSTAMFTATGLKPGATAMKCLAVTSTGSLASAVKLYGTSYSTTNAVGTWLSLTVTQGTGGSFAGGCGSFVADTSNSAVYSGTLANFGATATGYGSGVGSWTPTGSGTETKVFQFTYTLSASAPNSIEGGTAACGFTWEAQNS